MSAGPTSNNAELILLHQLLQDVELSQFANRIIDELQVTVEYFIFNFLYSHLKSLISPNNRYQGFHILTMLQQKTS